LAAVGRGVLQAIGVHLTVNALVDGVRALAFLAAWVGVSASSLGVPAAEVSGQAGVLVLDETVAGTALGGGELIPDARGVTLAVVLHGILADLADASRSARDVLAVGAGVATSGVTAEGSAVGFLALALGESVGVLGRALGGAFDELAVLALDTSADEGLGDFLATHLPAAGFGEALRNTGLVVKAVSVRVADARREAVARKDDVGVDGILG